MQKVTKDLFIRLKELRPIIHSMSYYYGMDWKGDKDSVVEYWSLEYPNKHFDFSTEEELRTEIKRLIVSTEDDLGFRFPHTKNKLKLNNNEPSIKTD